MASVAVRVMSRQGHAPKPAPVHPFDRQFGTDTSGLIPASALATGHSNDAHVTAYYGVAPSILQGVIDLWLRVGPSLPIDRYTFLDVGAGKGRAMLCASQHPFAQVVGVELNPGLAAIANANLVLFEEHPEAQMLSPARVVQGDALEVPLPEGPLLVFLFHPFEAPVLRRFAARLVAHGATERCDLLYVNSEHGMVLDRMERLERVFHGRVAMSAEDHLADLAEIEEQTEYGSTGDELCSLYRLV
jgi:SAM-dependent methyltransferase